VLGAEFLQAGDIRLRLFEPGDEIREALIDVVDVESGDLQGDAQRWRSDCALGALIAFIPRETPPGSEMTDDHRDAPNIFSRQTLWRAISGKPFTKRVVESRIFSFRPVPCALDECFFCS
jgi:hypothetical protein